jgi:hypothetical protein
MKTHPSPRREQRPRRILVASEPKPKTALDRYREAVIGDIANPVDIVPPSERSREHDQAALLTRATLLRIAASRAAGISLAHWSAGRLLEDECRAAGVCPHTVFWSGTRAEMLVAAALSQPPLVQPLPGRRPCPACDNPHPKSVTGPVLHVPECVLWDPSIPPEA